MLHHVAGVLACPVCGAGLDPGEGVLSCRNGHSYDVAKQGYVNLLPSGAQVGTADTAAMVDARSAFLAAGHYAGLADALSSVVGEARLIADVGAGTGYYLARVLADRPGAVGVALDLSKFALRRAARAHDRIGAVVADTWRGLPLLDGSLDVALNVFAPRNGGELRRVLRPGGTLVVVTPAAGHLGELVDRFGLLRVDEEKSARLRSTLDAFELVEARMIEGRMLLGRADVRALVLMGPSAWHVSPAEVDAAVAALPDPFPVTLSTVVSSFRPQGDRHPQGA